jgi:hypothetical protein
MLGVLLALFAADFFGVNAMLELWRKEGESKEEK